MGRTAGAVDRDFRSVGIGEEHAGASACSPGPTCDCDVSVSATTRQPRPGEQADRDYVFLSREQFERIRGRLARIGPGSRPFLRHAGRASPPGDGGGNLRDLGDRRSGRVSGSAKVPNALLIFVQPPSLEVLEEPAPRPRRPTTRPTIKRRLAERPARDRAGGGL